MAIDHLGVGSLKLPAEVVSGKASCRKAVEKKTEYPLVN